MKKHLSTLIFLLLLFGNAAFSQTATLSGKITSKGEPVSAANVTVVGTNIGTTSNAVGNYKLVVPAGKAITLKVSGIGYVTSEQSITLEANQSKSLSIEVTESNEYLSEVVVTGLSVNATQKELGTSRSSVKSDEIKAMPGPTIENVLVGRLAGVETYTPDGAPGGGFRIRVRGVNSIFAAPEPLVVIDGVLMDNGNQNTTSVLTAGANTGSASFGMNNGYRGLTAINPEDIETLEVLKGAGAAALYGSRASNGVIVVTTKKGGNGKISVNYTLDAGTNEAVKTSNIYKMNWSSTEIDQWATLQNARTTTPTYSAAQIAQWKANPMTDWTLEPARKASFIRHNVNVNGGNRDFGYYLSLNKQLNDGQAKGTVFNANGGRLALSSQAITGLTLRVTADYSSDFRTILPGGSPGFFYPNRWGLESTAMPFMRLQDIIAVSNGIKSPDSYAFVRKEYSSDRWVLSGSADYKITANLSANITVGQDNSQIFSNTIYPVGLVSIFPTGRLDFDSENIKRSTLTMGLNHVWQAKPNLYVKSAVGTQYDDNTRKYSYRRWNTRKDVGLAESDTNSYTTQQRGNNLDLETTARTLGIYFNETIGFNDKLFINLGGRFEKSTAFSQNFFFYPRATISYQLLPKFRVRGSYGVTGVQPPPYLTARSLRPDAAGFQGSGGTFAFSTPGNADLKPESQSEYEIGFDGSIFGGRVNVEFSYYNKDFKDLILSAPVNPSTFVGFSSAFRNVGEMYTRGYEFGINGDVIRSKGFTWNFGFTGSTYENKVTKLNNDGEVISAGLQSVSQIRVGYPIGGLWGGKTITTAAARTYVGSSLPSFEGGFNNTFEYKGFSVRALISGKTGMSRYNAGARDLVDPTKRMHTDFWSAQPSDAASSFDDITYWIQDASFWKLRQLSVSYNVNGKLLSTLGFKKLSVAFTGTNLVTWTSYKGIYDVESESSTSGTANNWIRGVDFWELGMPRSYTFTFNVGF